MCNEMVPFRITRTSSFFKRYLAFRRADVILFMNFTFSGIPVALLARRPMVLSHHGIYPSEGNIRRRIMEFGKRQLIRFFVNISVSHYVSENLRAKTFVIPNSFDDRSFYSTDEKKTLDFVFCGRLVSDKGAVVLLDALKLVTARFPHTTLTVIGDGPEKNKLQDRAVLLGLSDNVRFTGRLYGSELTSELLKHVCMTIPSLWNEPFGIVALEGIACCKTVISSNRGGLPEAVGNCGVLVDPTAEKFSDAMLHVLNTRKHKRVAGEPTAQHRAVHLAKHSSRSVALKYLKILRLVAEK